PVARGHPALVHGLLAGRGRGRLATRHSAAERYAPDERHVATRRARPAPVPDHLVVQVHLPVRVLIGGFVRELRDGAKVARVVAVTPGEGDVPEVLQALASGGGRRHVGAPAIRAFGIPCDLTWLSALRPLDDRVA